MVYRGYAPAGGGDLPYMSRDYHSASEHGEEFLEGPRFRDDSDARSLDSMPYRRGGRREEDEGPVRDRRPFRSRSGDSRDERPRYLLESPRHPDRPQIGGPRVRGNRSDERYAQRPRSSRYRDEDDFDYRRDGDFRRDGDYRRDNDYHREGDNQREGDYQESDYRRENTDYQRENPRYMSRKEPRTIRSRSRSEDEPDDYPRYRDRERKDVRHSIDGEGRYPEGGRRRPRGVWIGGPSKRDSEESAPVSPVPEEPAVKNMYQNDGSFLEMFKKMQEAQNPKPEEGAGAATSATDGTSKPDEQSSTTFPKKPVTSLVGKRRGGRVLPTGMVKKLKREDEEEKPTNAWSIYMAEVRKYKEASCEEEGKTRPLVK